MLIYIISTFLIFFYITKLSYILNIVDNPEIRKIHFKPVPNTGGIALVLILMFSIILFRDFDKILYSIIFVSIFISIIGFIDDRYDLNAFNKIILLIIPISYLIIKENLVINDIGYYQYFTIYLGPFSILFTLLCVLFLTNAFNYFDGMDGTLSITLISVILILYFLTLNSNFIFFLIIILSPITIFLFFNFSLFKLPKLFLGDSGSLLLGFLLSFLLIYLNKNNYAHPILLAWSVTIFVYEFLSVNIIRLINKKNLLKPQKDHLHHILFNKYSSLFLTNLIIFGLNTVLFMIGYLSWLLISPLTSLTIFVLLFFVFLFLRNKFQLLK